MKPVTMEKQSKSNIKAYLKESMRLDHHLANTLSEYRGKQIIIWGVGTFTMHLLAAGILHVGDIKVFVDSNPHYIGGSFQGIPVIAPHMLSAYTECIFISSFMRHDEIYKQIKKELKLSNEVIALRSMIPENIRQGILSC